MEQNAPTPRPETRARMRLTEEIILLLLNEESGYLEQVAGWNLSCVLAAPCWQTLTSNPVSTPLSTRLRWRMPHLWETISSTLSWPPLSAIPNHVPSITGSRKSPTRRTKSWIMLSTGWSNMEFSTMRMAAFGLFRQTRPMSATACRPAASPGPSYAGESSRRSSGTTYPTPVTPSSSVLPMPATRSGFCCNRKITRLHATVSSC